VSRPAFGGGMDTGVLFERLGWPMVQFEGISALYVRPSSRDADRTADLRFSLVGARTDAPTLLSRGKGDPAEMSRELARIDPARLLAAGDFNRLGAAAYGAGDLAAGERFFRAGLRRFPESREIRLNLSLLLMKAGREEEAREEGFKAERGRGR